MNIKEILEKEKEVAGAFANIQIDLRYAFSYLQDSFKNDTNLNNDQLKEKYRNLIVIFDSLDLEVDKFKAVLNDLINRDTSETKN